MQTRGLHVGAAAEPRCSPNAGLGQHSALGEGLLTDVHLRGENTQNCGPRREETYYMRFTTWQAICKDKAHRKPKVCVRAAGERSGLEGTI